MLINKNKKKGESKGFSLVELIVVIAIMALLIAILAPSLLAYVERSRAQKDDSAMGEVTNAIQLALADQKIFDEVLYYATYGNVSCYIDESSESAVASDEHVGGAINATVTKEVASGGSWNNQYLFGDNARLADESPYYFAGNMRGVTITFQPVKSSNASKIVLANGIINKALRASGAGATADVTQDTNLIADNRVADSETYINANPDYADAGTFGTMTSGSSGNTYLYNRVRATIGDEIELTSQTYRNSEYTVFIRIGSTGGNQASAQDAIVVYGQWSGTNLPVNATSLTNNGGGQAGELGGSHTHTVVIDAAKDPTCTETGLTEGSHCSECNEVIVAQEVVAAGHTAGSEKIENSTNANCTSGGSYDSVICCDVCGEELSRETVTVEAKGHTPGDAATCDAPQTCTVCGDTIEAAKGHNPGDAATCTTAQTCLDCGTTLKNALGHDNSYYPYYYWSSTHHYYLCNVCGEHYGYQSHGYQCPWCGYGW